MKVLASIVLLLTFFVGVSIQQCTIDDFQVMAISLINSTDTGNVISIINTYYNCLSLFGTSENYSSMSVSFVYKRSGDLDNTQHEVRYNLQCNNSVWEIVGNQSTALKNNNTRYCENCSDQAANEYHCTIG